jgi:protein O-mannosyl-transferase
MLRKELELMNSSGSGTKPAAPGAAKRFHFITAIWIFIIILAALTFVAYLPILHAGLVDFDDDTYITNNLHLQNGLTKNNIYWAFTAHYANNWHPLTWLSLMLDATLFRGQVWGYHLTNLLLHIANTILVFWLLLSLIRAGGLLPCLETAGDRKNEKENPESEKSKAKDRGKREQKEQKVQHYQIISSSEHPAPLFPLYPHCLWICAFVAALFALHPLHVESVAWVTERKDVLSTFFFLLTLLAYVRFLLPTVPDSRISPSKMHFLIHYCLVLFFFALGLMSKPMLVTLPILIYVIHFLRRPALSLQNSASPLSFNRIIYRPIPLLAMAVASSIITVWAQGNAVSPFDAFPFSIRASNALVAYIRYILKMLWPVNLSVFYRHLGTGLPQYQVLLSTISLLLISWIVIRQVRRRPYLAVGWLWYLITLIPVIGIIQAGAQSIADRYTYIPLIGLFVVVGFGLPDLISSLSMIGGKGAKAKGSGGITVSGLRQTPTVILASGSAIVIIVLSILTYRQVSLWQNSTTLFSHAVMLDDENYIAHSNYGLGLERQGFVDKAMAHYRRAIELHPNLAQAWNNLAGIYSNQARLDDAIDAYRTALKYQPDSSTICVNLGQLLERKGDFSQAAAYYAEALSKNPESWKAHLRMATSLQRQGKIQEANQHLTTADRLSPDRIEAHVNLGLALGEAGKLNEAILHLDRASRLDPQNANVQTNYGITLLKQGRVDDAIARFALTLKINSKDPFVHNYLAIAMYYKGRLADAWNEVYESRSYGGTPDPQFLKVLSEKMPDPGLAAK